MIRLGTWCAILAAAPCFAFAQVASTPDQSASCRRFARAFYNWYVPLIAKPSNGPASDIALRRKAEVFEPALLQELKLDSEARARAKGELVGIDFDPFVGGQDPADRYEVRAVRWQNNQCSAEVWSVSTPGTAAPTGKPDVVAEILQHDGHWQFSNFRYPELNTDLATVLAQLRAERRRNVQERK